MKTWLMTWNQDVWLVYRSSGSWVTYSKHATITYFDPTLLSISDLSHHLCFTNNVEFCVAELTEGLFNALFDYCHAEFVPLVESAIARRSAW